METHKVFVRRASILKSTFDFLCACNTAYGSGLILKRYTDLVIGLLGFGSSMLGVHRAWLRVPGMDWGAQNLVHKQTH